MRLSDAAKIAHKCLTVLKTHCERIEIAGSIRRQETEVGDIEIVCIPKHVIVTQDALFGSPAQQSITSPEFIAQVEKWQEIKGHPTGRYTQRLLPEGIKLDLFMTTAQNWGYIYAIRTGPWEYSKYLVTRAKRMGYEPINGMLKYRNQQVILKEEKDLFDTLNMGYVLPQFRWSKV